MTAFIADTSGAAVIGGLGLVLGLPVPAVTVLPSSSVAAPAKALPQPGTCNQGHLFFLASGAPIREPFVTGVPLGLASYAVFFVDGFRMLPAGRLLG